MADFTAVTSGIGQGKTLWMTMRIMDVLEKTDRLIVTDIPLVIELKTPVRTLWTLAEYCQKFIKRPINIAQRIAVLDFDCGSEFWRYLPAAAYPEWYLEKWLNHENPEKRIEIVEVNWAYGSNRLVKLPNKKNVRFKFVPDFDFRTSDVVAMRGVDYFKDEAHKAYPPMYYQNVGAQCDWYVTELRRLDDNATWCSQHPEKVDKNFRRLTTEWWQVQNMSKSPLFMGVTFKNRFRWHWYCQPEMPTRLDKPTASGWYRIDKTRRIHDLYDTMATSSMTGNTLVLHGNQYKGRSPLVWAAVPVIVFALAFIVPRLLSEGMTWVTRSLVQGGLSGVQRGLAPSLELNPALKPVAVTPIVVQPTVRQFVPRPPMVVTATHPVEPPAEQPEEWAGVNVTGVALSPSGVTVFLSNGMTLDTNDVAAVGKRWIRLKDGTKLPIVGQTPQPAAPPSPWGNGTMQSSHGSANWHN